MSRAIRNALTSAGTALIAQSIAQGVHIVFTQAKIGTGSVDDETSYADGTAGYEAYLKAKTDVIEYLADGEITKKGATLQSLHLNVVFSNTVAHLDESADIDEVGIYAKLDGSLDDPVLFSYMTFGDYIDTILPESIAEVIRNYTLAYNFDGTQTSVQVNHGAYVYQVEGTEPDELGNVTLPEITDEDIDDIIDGEGGE